MANAELTRTAYEAVPMVISPDRMNVASTVLRSLCRFETIFTDYGRACPDVCLECDLCQQRMRAVVAMLLAPNARVWEVWRLHDPEVVGILYLTDIVPGNNATAHYAFWDGGIRSKTDVIQSMIDWVFADHDGWIGLRRLTLEVPVYAYMLALHAEKKLGFGGDYQYRLRRGKGHGKGNRNISVEGVKRKAIRWRGADHDILVLGRLRDG